MRKLLALLLLLPSLAHGAITHRFTGTAANAIDGGSHTPTLGGTANAGDLILCASTQKNATDYTTISSSGYTQLYGKTNSGGTAVVLLGKIAAGSDADPSISSSDTTSGRTIISQCSVWSGTLNTVTGIVAHQNSAQNDPAFSITMPALTGVTTPNTLILSVAGKANDWNAENPVIGASDALTELGQPERTASAQVGLVWAYRVQTTATDVTTGDVTLTENSARAASIIVSLKPAAVTPLYTSDPAIQSRTTSSIVFRATTDTTGTRYGARLTDGSSAPTCDQLEAQTATGGVQYGSQAATADTLSDLTLSSITDGTVTDYYECMEDAGGNDSAVKSIADVYKTAAFSVAPTVSAQGTGDYTITKTLDGAGSCTAVACLKDSTAPSDTETLAGYCDCVGACDGAGGDVAAIATVTDASCEAGTMALGSGLTRPIHDIYVVGTYGGFESAVTALVDECLDAATGKQLVNCPDGLTSIDGGSPIVTFNSTVTPDIAVGDIPVVDLTTTPGGCDLTPTATGLYSYPGSCGPNAQYHDWTFYDLSAGAMHADTMRAWTNNTAPQASVSVINLEVVEGAAVASITYADLVTDPDGQAITCTTQDTGTGTGEGKRPAGTTTTSGVFDGTYTTAGSGSFGMSCADPAGAAVVITTNWLVVAPSAIPDCVGETLTACLDLMSEAYIDVSATFECSFTAPALEVISQDPTSPTVVDPFTEVDVVVSRGICGTRPYKRLGIGIQLGL
jgi:hypothetical protein